jgi:transcriptional regulator with XRE-family HTH domain
MTVNLKAERLNKGLSLADAADEIGVPKHVLLGAETGQNTPRPANAFKIAGFYGFKVTDVWPLEESAA